MKNANQLLAVFVVFASAVLIAQTTTPDAANAGMPRVIKYAGVLPATLSGHRTVVQFSIFSTKTGGTSLWSERQTVIPETSGRFSVLLGAGSPNGISSSVFTDGEAKWLEVAVDGSEPQGRVLLVSVPYAFHSADAESLGGHSASEFVSRAEIADLVKQYTPAAALPASPSRLTSPNVSASAVPHTILGAPIGPYDVASANFAASGTASVKDFGAVGDGITDDTAALQAAIDHCPAYAGRYGCIITLPAGTYRLTSTLRLYRNDGQLFIRLLGSESLVTRIEWHGPADGAAVDGERLVNFEIANLSIFNGNPVGTGTGLVLASPYAGNGTNSGIIKAVTINGFDNGLVVGNNNDGAASELTYINLQVTNNHKGITIHAQNSLDNNFYQLEGAFNSEYLLSNDGDGGALINVFGGTGSFNGTEFLFPRAGTYGIHNFRSESAGKFLQAARTEAPSLVTIDGCTSYWSTDSDATLVRALGGMLMLSVNDSLIFGNIELNTGATNASVQMRNVGVFSNSPFVPLGAHLRYSLRGVFKTISQDNGYPASTFADSEGLAGAGTISAVVTYPQNSSEQLVMGTQLHSTVSGAAPIVVDSTVPVANLTLASDAQLPTITSSGKIAESALPAGLAKLNSQSNTFSGTLQAEGITAGQLTTAGSSQQIVTGGDGSMALSHDGRTSSLLAIQTWSATDAMPLSTAGTFARFSPVEGIRVRRVEASLMQPPTGCTTTPVLTLAQGSVQATMPVTSDYQVLNAGDVSFAADTPINASISSGSGCTNPGQNLTVTMQYEMN